MVGLDMTNARAPGALYWYIAWPDVIMHGRWRADSLSVEREQREYLVNVLLLERSSIMSFLELPLLVMFIHNRMSCRTAVQSGFAGTTAPNDPEDIHNVMPEGN